MLEFSTVSEWKEVFGSSYDNAVFELVDTHHLFEMRGEMLYFRFNLEELFEEMIDMREVDPDLVDDMVQINMIFSDTDMDPVVLTNLLDFTEDKFGYSPIDNSGGFSLSITDVRKYYGEEEFDREMDRLFPGYTKWW